MELPDVVIQTIEDKNTPPFSRFDYGVEDLEVKGVAVIEQMTNGKKHGVKMWMQDNDGRNFTVQIPGEMMYSIMGKYALAEERFKELKDKRKK